MASTAGGFLLGFGLCLLIFSLFLSVVVEEAYRELEKSGRSVQGLKDPEYELYGKYDKPLTKLLDEYNWLTITRKNRLNRC